MDGRQPVKVPNVTVYPVYGTNVSTSIKFVYDNGNKHPPSATIKTMDGDGTVVWQQETVGVRPKPC